MPPPDTKTAVTPSHSVACQERPVNHQASPMTRTDSPPITSSPHRSPLSGPEKYSLNQATSSNKGCLPSVPRSTFLFSSAMMLLPVENRALHPLSAKHRHLCPVQRYCASTASKPSIAPLRRPPDQPGRLTSIQLKRPLVKPVFQVFLAGCAVSVPNLLGLSPPVSQIPQSELPRPE